ncbi:glycosyltransferase family 2 protein [Sphaerimonospora cavernae]|uniref:Glycosyltransferase family 2 protein n=1 Tax=Sphaerimonospora cavernae TaxID=1740611 RepID=A0ABV6U1Y5_9ACTN
MTPTVSVIVPTFNRPHLLAEALASVAAQTGVEVEAVVVNDGGQDVKPVIEQATPSLETRLITLEANQGLPAARNAALDAAAGEYVAFLDDDDVFLPGHLATAVAVLRAAGVDVAYTSCSVSPRRVTPSRGPVHADHVFDFPFHAEALHVANYIPVTPVVARNLPADARFDETLPVEEDWDMWLRLHHHHAAQFVHVPKETVVYHRVADTASMTNGTGAGVGAALTVFRSTHHQLMTRWPVPAGGAADLGRRYLLAAYAIADEELAAGRHVSPFYYERVIRLLYGLVTGTVGEAGLRDRLADAVTREDS